MSWDQAPARGGFQYDPAFVGAGFEVAPLAMPAREAPYEFPALNRENFRARRGCWQMPCRTGSATASLTPGWRMPARARRPSTRPTGSATSAAAESAHLSSGLPCGGRPARKQLEVANLVSLANRVLGDRADLAVRLDRDHDAGAPDDIPSVGARDPRRRRAGRRGGVRPAGHARPCRRGTAHARRPPHGRQPTRLRDLRPAPAPYVVVNGGSLHLAGIGRYGPWLKHGAAYVSLSEDEDVLTVGLNRALARVDTA